MSDGFSSGIQAAQGYAQQQQQQSTLLAQIYSAALQTNAQMEMEKFKAYHDMQREMAQQAGLERRAQISAKTDMEKEALKQKAETGRSILHEEAENQRKMADLLETRTTEILKQRMQDATTERGQDLDYRGKMEGHLITARQQAQASLLTAQGNLTNYALQQEMPIEQAVALGRTAGLPPQEAMAIASTMRNPKAERAGAKAQADLVKSAAETAEVQQRVRMKPAEFRLDTLKHGETVRHNVAEEMATSQANFMKLAPLYGDWLKKHLTTTNPALKDPAVAKAAQSAFSQMTQLADARAAGRIDDQTFLRGAVKLRASGLSGISDEVLQQGLLYKSLLTGNAARFSGAAGVAVGLMPVANLAAAHREQPPETRSLIDSFLSAATMHIGERVGKTFSGASPDGDRLTNAYSAAYGQTHLNAGGKATAPPPQALRDFDARSPWEKVQILRGMRDQSEAARDAVSQYDTYSVNVGSTLTGDAARILSGQEKQGDWGLLGDAGSMLVGGLIGKGGKAFAGWMWGMGKGIKYTAPIFNKAEAAAGKVYDVLGRPFGKPPTQMPRAEDLGFGAASSGPAGYYPWSKTGAWEGPDIYGKPQLALPAWTPPPVRPVTPQGWEVPYAPVRPPVGVQTPGEILPWAGEPVWSRIPRAVSTPPPGPPALFAPPAMRAPVGAGENAALSKLLYPYGEIPRLTLPGGR